MIDPVPIERWLELYRTAWTTDAEEDVSRLFTDDARYFAAPFSEPLRGVQEIVEWWREQGESAVRWSFEHKVVAQERDLYVVRGLTRYPDGLNESGSAEEFHNIWLVRLAADGRATEFTEYWMSVE